MQYFEKLSLEIISEQIDISPLYVSDNVSGRVTKDAGEGNISGNQGTPVPRRDR